MELKELLKQVVIPENGNVGPFKVKDLMTSGGQTTYLRAVDSSGHEVALKIPNRECAQDANLRSRFEREVEILGKLNGPEYPTLRGHGFFEAAGIRDIPYIATDVPRGMRMDLLLDQQHDSGVTPDVALGVKVFRNLGRALSAAHAQGIVHRNLKPARISVDNDGNVQIVDFVLGLDSGAHALTGAGVLLGTPQYIAPEQIVDAHGVDGRADLYSLGVIMYEWFTHQHPFGPTRGNARMAIMKKLTQDPRPVREENSRIPPPLEAVVMRCLKRAREERFQNTAELLTALEPL